MRGRGDAGRGEDKLPSTILTALLTNDERDEFSRLSLSELMGKMLARWIYTPRLDVVLLDDSDQPLKVSSTVVSATSVSKMMAHCLDSEDAVGDDRHRRRWSELVVAIVLLEPDRRIGLSQESCRMAAMVAALGGDDGAP
ncbi:hypothetical protein ACLOJK_026841 [Asimina triloba]